ncbi:WecB/TagA/CpsF family glycosyltransferase [Blastococcus brunescens]|uniref:WecB/TagA/CpsF family glycosyltransferase n=1 Tax=Blastococcus brunescens TaxID=1564165 RepID=UPI003BEEF9A6
MSTDSRILELTVGALGFSYSSPVTYGVDIFRQLCHRAEASGLKVGLYGGGDAVLADLQRRLKTEFPDLRVAFAESPPFADAERLAQDESVERIKAARLDILFVGLGCPKQESWMSNVVGEIGCMAIGLGSAFDFLAGAKQISPLWVRRAGLDWLWRLGADPRRLWRRYVLGNSLFLWRVLPSSLDAASEALRSIDEHRASWGRLPRRRSRPPLILITGVDGAGKSAATAGACDALRSARMPFIHVHHRPGLVIPYRRRPTGPVSMPHAGAPHSLGSSILKVFATLLDWKVAQFVWRQRDCAVVVERGWYDMFVDPHRYRLHMWSRILVKWLSSLMRADLAIMLFAEPDAIRARKPELTATAIREQQRRWRDARGLAASCARIDTTEGGEETTRDLASDAVRRVIAKQGRPQAAAEEITLVGGADEAGRMRVVPFVPRRLELTSNARDTVTIRTLYRPGRLRGQMALEMGASWVTTLRGADQARTPGRLTSRRFSRPSRRRSMGSP